LRRRIPVRTLRGAGALRGRAHRRTPVDRDRRFRVGASRAWTRRPLRGDRGGGFPRRDHGPDRRAHSRGGAEARPEFAARGGARPRRSAVESDPPDRAADRARRRAYGLHPRARALGRRDGAAPPNRARQRLLQHGSVATDRCASARDLSVCDLTVRRLAHEGVGRVAGAGRRDRWRRHAAPGRRAAAGPMNATVLRPSSVGEPSAAPRAIALRTEKLSAYYGAAQAVGDVDLTFEVGAVTAIIGPSGCGKSMLLRCLNRMHETTPGAR